MNQAFSADIRTAFPDVTIPQEDDFYGNVMFPCAEIYRGCPEWGETKRSGLYGKGSRKLAQLKTAKVLCDELAAMSFSEQTEISVSSEQYQEYVETVLEGNSFWENIPEWLSKAYALGGGVLKVFAQNGKPTIDFLGADCFYPESYTNRRIDSGFFKSVHVKGNDYYTLFERYGLKDGKAFVENKLFRSSEKSALGHEVPLSELYEDAPEKVEYQTISEPMFAYFKPATPNNLDDGCLGLSVFANCTDTLKAIDTAFDSLSREVVLGRKRIIVPSSCIRTVVDPESGTVNRYFDSDDEVYQALKCDEEKDLHITDNTMEIRVEQHTSLINANLNLLCFQTGLTAGTFSFDAKGGLKTAYEVASENSKTYRTMAAHKNMLSGTFIQLVRSIIQLGQELGHIPQGDDYEVVVGFNDNIVVDDDTLIDQNIKLVSAGLKSKVSAIMAVLKCTEEEALAELERIKAEEPVMSANFDPNIG